MPHAFVFCDNLNNEHEKDKFTLFCDDVEILKKYKHSQLPYMRVMNGEQFNVSRLP